MITNLIISVLRFLLACIVLALAALIMAVGTAWERVRGKEIGDRETRQK